MYHAARSLEKSDFMRQLIEMKQNGFLSNPLSSTPVEVPVSKVNQEDGDARGASNGDGDRWGPLEPINVLVEVAVITSGEENGGEDDVLEDKELESVVEGDKDGDEEDDDDEAAISRLVEEEPNIHRS
ncbi:hypothetical protein Bca101_075445 [Brassica carinata]